jgi:hypothetical protein
MLEALVRSWSIAPGPEFRRFRCGGCQEHLRGAVHHARVVTAGLDVDVHLCGGCADRWREGALPAPSPADASVHLLSPPPDTVLHFADIVRQRRRDRAPAARVITCDECAAPLAEDAEGFTVGWHVWWRAATGCLTELHFDAGCGGTLLISSMATGG